MRITPIDFSPVPLYSLFKNSIALVLGEAKRMGSIEQTVPMLSEATRLDYNTVQSALHHLTRLGLVEPTRKVGNTQAYKFNLGNKLYSRLD